MRDASRLPYPQDVTGDGAKADTVLAASRPAGVDLWMGEREPLLAHVVRSLRLGRGTLVLGAAGVGKSHLADLALRSSGRAAAIAPPGRPPEAPSTTPHEAVSRSLGLSGSPRSDDEALATVRGWLLDEPDARTPVLRVEDAHLLDRVYAEAVAVLARRGEIVLLATARPIAGSVSPWHELWREDVVDRVDLRDLTLTEAEAMLASELGGDVSAVAHRLWVETGGNAAYLRALVEDLQTSGALVEHVGTWVLTDEPVPSHRLLQTARGELDGLGEDGVRAVQALALLGPLALGSVLDLVERKVLDDLLVRGLVRTASTGKRPELQIELAHRLLGHAVRDTTPSGWRHALLQRAADPTSEGPPSRQAVMLMLADGVQVAPTTVTAAAAAALANGEPEDALVLVDAMLERAGVVISDQSVAAPGREGIVPGGYVLTPAEAAALLLDRALAHQALGHHRSSLTDVGAALPRLDRAIREHPDDRALPRLALELARLGADLAELQGGGVDAALASFAEGARRLDLLTTRPEGAQLDLQLEVARLARLGYAGRHAEAQEDGLRLLDEAPNPRLVLPLVCPIGLGLLQSGRFDDVWRIVRRYRPVAAASAEPGRGAEVAVVGFMAQLLAGEIAPLEGLVSAGLDVAHSTIQWAGAPISRGLVAAACGAWSAARRELHAATLRVPVSAVPASLPYARAAEALAAAASGETDDARALLKTIERSSARVTAVLSAELRLLRVDTQIWLQDPDAPRAAQQLAEWARAAGMPRIELEALHRAQVLDRRNGVTSGRERLARARALRGRVRSPRAAAILQHVEALTEQDVDLEGIAERELSRRGLWLPPGPGARALTAREREIAALARARLTSRTIATRLGLSARTVDSHLASVFTKLGIRSREDLSHALH